MFSIRFDMRAPSIGATTTDLYATAIDMCSWADQHGCLAAVLCEHHGSEDGYNSAPFVLAYVELDEGPRVMTNVVEADAADLAVGLPVDVVFHDGSGEGRISTGPGDYIFVPPYVPHREENPGDTEAVVVIARSSQEGIVVNLESLWPSQP